jgi:hypothetical protein
VIKPGFTICAQNGSPVVFGLGRYFDSVAVEAAGADAGGLVEGGEHLVNFLEVGLHLGCHALRHVRVVGRLEIGRGAAADEQLVG